MDKDRIHGAVDQAKGSAKEKLGKTLGDQKLRTEGAADKVKGKVESAVGGANIATTSKVFAGGKVRQSAGLFRLGHSEAAS